ncbi:MAG: protein kinase domain-containing protein [Elainellaceae cyanobacterium]
MGLNPLRLFKLTVPQKPLAGHYKIIRQLGSGGFGQTFLAIDLHLPGQPQCVIKQLKPQVSDAASFQTARRLFDTEARVLYELGNHYQIPRLLAHFEEDREFYLAQELIDGDSLTQELELGTPWPDIKVVVMLQDLLEVLSFVHQRQVIHRDIKPSNLIRRHHDRKIVLIDFGAVKQVSTQVFDASTGSTKTISIGTQGYMPNEQLGGKPHFSSDIYAVGMIGIQALTGVHPRFLESDPRTSEIIWRHRVPQVNTELADLLDHMVRYDFRDRFSTAVEALRALQNLPESLIGELDITEQHVDSSSNASTIFPPTSLPDSHPSGGAAGSIHRATPDYQVQNERSPVSSANSARSSSPTYVAAKPYQVTQTGTFDIRDLTRSPMPVLAVAIAGLAVVIGVAAVRLTPKPAQDPAPDQTTANPALESPEGASDPSGEGASESPLSVNQTTLNQADRLREAEEYQQAIALYDQVISQNPDIPDAYWGRCYSLNKLQQPEPALQACNQALALDPSNAQALWSKGHALEQLQRYDDALGVYDQLIALRPDFAHAWNNKGTALLSIDRPGDALESFDRALNLNPQLAEAWNNRGAALWSLQDFDEALDSVNRALEIRPDYKDARELQREMRKRLRRD